MEEELYQKVVQLYNFMCMVDTECHINSTNFMKIKSAKVRVCKRVDYRYRMTSQNICQMMQT